MKCADRQYTEKFLTVLLSRDNKAAKLLKSTVDRLYKSLESYNNAESEAPDNIIRFKDITRQKSPHSTQSLPG
ncbi:MAG: hypothetical protein HON76_13555 [Candidatus Scalindua sp.]|nr:hypothetical protein [Candidatus Scalindua sp.]MBT6563543.1 hypothetical protein [Candidatus Scalindua sp.]